MRVGFLDVRDFDAGEFSRGGLFSPYAIDGVNVSLDERYRRYLRRLLGV